MKQVKLYKIVFGLLEKKEDYADNESIQAPR